MSFPYTQHFKNSILNFPVNARKSYMIPKYTKDPIPQFPMDARKSIITTKHTKNQMACFPRMSRVHFRISQARQELDSRIPNTCFCQWNQYHHHVISRHINPTLW